MYRFLFFFMSALFFMLPSGVNATDTMVNSVNNLHRFSHKKWRFQKDYFSETVPRADGEYDLREMKPRYGHYIEGMGEIADIATMYSTSPLLIKLANITALVARLADILLGSFPEMPRIKMCSLDGRIPIRQDYLDDTDPTPMTIAEPSRLNFWKMGWARRGRISDSNDSIYMIPHYLIALGANQLSKLEGVYRAWQRIKNAPILAEYNKTLPKSRKWQLLIDQLAQVVFLVWGLHIKYKGQWKHVIDRYPGFIQEAVMSMLRRYRLSKVENDLLCEARHYQKEKQEIDASANSGVA